MATQEFTDEEVIDILPDFEGLKEFYFATGNADETNYEEITVYWRADSFEFSSTGKTPQHCPSCHHIKYKATAIVDKKNTLIPHKAFCKIQHACTSLATCRAPSYKAGHQSERIAQRKRKREEDKEEKQKQNKRRKVEEEEARKKTIEDNAKAVAKSAKSSANRFESVRLSSYLNSAGLNKIMHGSARILNDAVKVTDYVSSLGSEQTLFNWNNMTKVEKEAAQLGCKILGQTNPTWTTYEPGLEDYDGAIAFKETQLVELQLAAMNLAMEISQLRNKRDTLIIKQAKENLVNGGWCSLSDGATVSRSSAADLRAEPRPKGKRIINTKNKLPAVNNNNNTTCNTGL